MSLMNESNLPTARETEAPCPADPRVDRARLATPAELIKVFGPVVGMNESWFDAGRLTDAPKLRAARKVPGTGGGRPQPPLFCPLEVMLWLIDSKRRKGQPLHTSDGWRLLALHFPFADPAHPARLAGS